MQKVGKEIFLVNKELFILFMAAFLVAILPASLLASVQGPCANCHTMHNSQGGATQAATGTDAHWTGATFGGTGASTTTPNDGLLKTDCIGCHSETGVVTAVPLGGDAFVPIVWNLGGYPAQPLAGGNFFNVATDDAYGHNVFGISAPDGDLSEAPGWNGGIGCASSCHTSLAMASSANGAYGGTYTYNGCRGCHIVAGLNGGAHHDSSDTSYRMLKGHLDDTIPGADMVVVGAEDNSSGGLAGWEANGVRHNTYLNIPNATATTDLSSVTLGRFCSGCHGDFHALGEDGMMFPNINGGDVNVVPLDNPWLRHPNDVVIPFGQHDYVASNFNKDFPVGQDAVDSTLNAGDRVICVSCHRAHGSNYPDALRWDYANQTAHTSGPGDETGCFYCHRSKDDVP